MSKIKVGVIEMCIRDRTCRSEKKTTFSETGKGFHDILRVRKGKSP